MLRSNEIRKKFLDFFKDKGHYTFDSFSLIPTDKTVLFITAGMQPLIPYLLGKKHPKGSRLASSQKCLRTDDILEVGDNRHLTFFEMLGNWSLGDYFKKEAIEWSFEFLTDKKNGLGLDPKRLYVSVFEGDEISKRDDESISIWKNVFAKAGINADVGTRIFLYPKEKNWWEPSGKNVPVGPDTEIFYDTGIEHKKEFGESCHINCDCGKYVEIWNNVFMEYLKRDEGRYEPLSQKNVDTGMGLERITMVVQKKETVFETDLFWPIIESLQKKSQKKYEDDKRSFRIVSDHIKASAFLISDGILPSNKDQGYILRRLIRRAYRHIKAIEFQEDFSSLVETITEIYKDSYPLLFEDKENIVQVIENEVGKFKKALKNGLKHLKGWVLKNKDKLESLTDSDFGKLAFYMYESYGFPASDTFEELRNMGVDVDLKRAEKVFDLEFKSHQEKSKKGAEKKFGGHGLLLQTGELKAKDEEELKKVTRLHTATHLLHEALRRVLGSHVRQMGSDITAERLRFDFSHPQKLTEEEKKKIEDLVNEQIQKGLEVKYEEMGLDEAEKSGALGFFKERYQDRVKVYSIGDFSKEICGGPHVKNTKELGRFKIKKEESSSAGVRRIKAMLED